MPGPSSALHHNPRRVINTFPDTLLADPAVPAVTLTDLWVYIVIGFTSNFLEEPVPIVAGYGAFEGRLVLSAVVIAVVGGTWLGAIALYFLGRWRGKWLRQRYRTLGRHLVGAVRFVRRHPWRASMLVRFAYGAKLFLPIALGAAHVRLPLFLIGTLISSTLWALLFIPLGWAFGEATMQLLGQIRPRLLPIALVLGVVAVIWLLHRQGRVERVVEKVVIGDEPPDDDMSFEPDPPPRRRRGRGDGPAGG